MGHVPTQPSFLLSLMQGQTWIQLNGSPASPGPLSIPSQAPPLRKALHGYPPLVVPKALTNILTINSFCFIVFLALAINGNGLEGHPTVWIYQALQVVLGHVQVEKQWRDIIRLMIISVWSTTQPYELPISQQPVAYITQSRDHSFAEVLCFTKWIQILVGFLHLVL